MTTRQPVEGGAAHAAEAPEPSPVVAMQGIVRRYGEGPAAVTAVDGVDLTIDRGDFVAIVGESGSGKSTLLQIAGCLDRPDAGSYVLDGRDVSRLSDPELARVRNRTIGFVFQAFHLLGDRTALENVGLPLTYRRHDNGDEDSPAGDPKEMLERVGLAARGGHRPSQLSGGERQRVAIARALVKRPPLLLCDEPTGNLDSRTGEEILALFGELNRAGRTLVIVTHDTDVAQHCGRAVHMRDGKIVDGAGTT